MKRRLTLDEVNGTSKDGHVFAGYFSLTQEERDQTIAQGVHGREVERHQYALNAYNYQQLLESEEMKSLPDQWPSEIQQFQFLSREQVAAITSQDQSLDADLIFKLQHRDRLRHLLMTELVELEKVENYHKQILLCLPDERREGALQKARQWREIQ